MAEGDPKATDPGQMSGLLVVGSFKGVKAPAPYEIDGRSGTSAPKVGIEDEDGNVFRITVSEETYRQYVSKPRGSRVAIPVNARPPFRQGQGVRLIDRSVTSDGEQWD